VLARVVALSPQATLDRGYAVVQDEDGAVVRDADAVQPGTDLQVRLAAASCSSPPSSPSRPPSRPPGWPAP
jgi:exodeoxyribonuclease VII large subunit